MRKVCLVIALLAILVAAAPASAATKKQARRAVAHEVRAVYYDVDATVECVRLTRRRFKCRWYGLSSLDVDNGNVEGWAGTARVRFYGRVADVSLHVTR